MVVTLGQQYNIGGKPTVMEINYNMMCIVSPRKDHLTFFRRKPSPSLNTSEQIQAASKEDLSRGRSFIVIYKFSFLVTNSTKKGTLSINLLYN